MLSPPRPPRRSRASSTSLRPPLSLPTLAPRRRSSSLSIPSSASPPHSPISPHPAPQPDPMFPVLVSRCLQLLRSLRRQKHYPILPSPISSPRSSSDTDYILPLSASHYKTEFDHLSTPPPPAPVTALSSHTPLLLVLLLFPLSTAVILFSLSTLPISASWPRNLTDLAQLGRELSAYAKSGLFPTTHVIAVLSVTAVWKHAWSVPGSVLWNVLAGALFHPLLATLLLTTLTTVGSIFSTLLAAPLAPLITRFFPRPVELTRAALEGSSSSLSSPSNADVAPRTPAWVRLSVLRLIGVVPWSGINIACGLTGVALLDCARGAFIGTLPWTAVTCQIGDILQTVAASDSGAVDGARSVSSLLASPTVLLELVFLSVLSLAPILGREYLRRLIASPTPSDRDSESCNGYEDENEKMTGTVHGHSSRYVWSWAAATALVPAFTRGRGQSVSAGVRR